MLGHNAQQLKTLWFKADICINRYDTEGLAYPLTVQVIL